MATVLTTQSAINELYIAATRAAKRLAASPTGWPTPSRWVTFGTCLEGTAHTTSGTPLSTQLFVRIKGTRSWLGQDGKLYMKQGIATARFYRESRSRHRLCYEGPGIIRLTERLNALKS